MTDQHGTQPARGRWLNALLRNLGLVPGRQHSRRTPFLNAWGSLVVWLAATFVIPLAIIWLLRAPEVQRMPTLFKPSELTLLLFLANISIILDAIRVRKLLIARHSKLLTSIQILHPLLTIGLAIIYARLSSSVSGRLVLTSEGGNSTSRVGFEAMAVDGFDEPVAFDSGTSAPGEGLSTILPIGPQEFPVTYIVVLGVALLLSIWFKYVLELASEQQEIRFEQDTYVRLRTATQDLHAGDRDAIHARFLAALHAGRIDASADPQLASLACVIGYGFLVDSSLPTPSTTG